MLFDNTEKYPFIEWIKDGKKKQTIRMYATWSMRVGDVYPVFDAENGHYQKKRDALCHIQCTNRHTKRYFEINRADALREGFRTLREFKEYMESRYSVKRDRAVMVYQFELVK